MCITYVKTNMPTLTKRQKEILDFIKFYIKKNGYSPTFEEIKKKFRLKALSGVHQHIEALIRKGYIEKNDNLKNLFSNPLPPVVFLRQKSKPSKAFFSSRQEAVDDLCSLLQSILPGISLQYTNGPNLCRYLINQAE